MKILWKVFKVLCWIGIIFVAGFVEGCCFVSRDVYEFGDNAVERAKDLGRSSLNLRNQLRKLKDLRKGGA